MVTFGGLTRTFQVTKNPLPAISLMLGSGKHKTVTFKNGFKFQLTWQQFRTLRDNYSLINKFAISQVKDDLFKIENNESKVTCNCSLIPVVCGLMQKYTVTQEDDNSFKVSGDNFEIVGDSAMLLVVQEQETGEYIFDYRGKVVLDVGGYQGESAVFFARQGASKVIVYEPVLANHKFIRKNISLNLINAEIHEEGISDKDGTQTISYCDVNTSFGLPCKGEHRMEIKVRNVANVLDQSGADVAKIDCEGAEESLTGVPAEILRKTKTYIIEVHTPQIRKLVLEKFKASGFKLTKETPKTPLISVVTLDRIDNLGKSNDLLHQPAVLTTNKSREKAEAAHG